MAFNYIILDSNNDNPDIVDGNYQTVNNQHTVITINPQIEGKDSNFITIVENYCKWLKYADNSNGLKTEVQLFLDKNLKEDSRKYTLYFLNNQTGEIDALTIEQLGCNYALEIEENENVKLIEDGDNKIVNVVFPDRNTDTIEMVFKVFGNSKKCNVTDKFFKICDENGKYLSSFDKGLSYKIEEIIEEEKNIDYKKYKLLLKYLGKIFDDEKIIFEEIEVEIDTKEGKKKEKILQGVAEKEKYMYVLTLQHADNKKTKQIVNIDVSKIQNDELTNDGILINSMDDSINKYQEKDWDDYIINDNVISEVENYSISDIVSEIEGIVVNNIDGNVITVTTQVYNNKGEIEYDSLVMANRMSKWCSIEDEYDKDKKQHKIKVICEKNLFPNNRISRMVLRNAENINGIKKFYVEQDINNNITIKERND